MAIRSQRVEDRDIDIATVPIVDLQMHYLDLAERQRNLLRSGEFRDVPNVIDAQAAVLDAIRDRTNGREVNPQDRSFMLHENQHAAEREFGLQPLVERPNIQTQYEAAVAKLEPTAVWLSRDPDVREELKSVWSQVQEQNPGSSRSETLSYATETLGTVYQREHEQEKSLGQEVSVGMGM